MQDGQIKRKNRANVLSANIEQTLGKVGRNAKGEVVAYHICRHDREPGTRGGGGIQPGYSTRMV